MISQMISDIGKPYSYRRTKACWFGSSYRILYRGDPTFELTVGSRQMAKDTVDALNIAHQMGMIDAYGYLKKDAEK